MTPRQASALVARYKQAAISQAEILRYLPKSEEERQARLVVRYKQAVIRKEKGEYCVKSPNNPDWNGGCYPSKEKAEERLKAVEYFKHNE